MTSFEWLLCIVFVLLFVFAIFCVWRNKDLRHTATSMKKWNPRAARHYLRRSTVWFVGVCIATFFMIADLWSLATYRDMSEVSAGLSRLFLRY